MRRPAMVQKATIAMAARTPSAEISVVTMPWLVRRLVTYTVELWSDFHRYLG